MSSLKAIIWNQNNYDKFLQLNTLIWWVKFQYVYENIKPNFKCWIKLDIETSL